MNVTGGHSAKPITISDLVSRPNLNPGTQVFAISGVPIDLGDLGKVPLSAFCVVKASGRLQMAPPFALSEFRSVDGNPAVHLEIPVLGEVLDVIVPVAMLSRLRREGEEGRLQVFLNV